MFTKSLNAGSSRLAAVAKDSGPSSPSVMSQNALLFRNVVFFYRKTRLLHTTHPRGEDEQQHSSSPTAIRH